MTYEIIGYDRHLVHAGIVETDGIEPETVLDEAFKDWAEERNVPRHELPGMVAVGWPTGHKDQAIEIDGREYAN